VKRPRKGRQRRSVAADDRDDRADGWDDGANDDGMNDRWNDPVKIAKMRHVCDILSMGADPNGEKVQRLIREASVCTINDPGYDPFAGRTEEEKREWHLFMLFLLRHCGFPPEGIGHHVEWLLRNGWNTPAEWLGRTATSTAELAT